MARDVNLDAYDGPAGGWGSAKSVTRAMIHEKAPFKTLGALYKQNKLGGFVRGTNRASALPPP